MQDSVLSNPFLCVLLDKICEVESRGEILPENALFWLKGVRKDEYQSFHLFLYVLKQTCDEQTNISM